MMRRYVRLKTALIATSLAVLTFAASRGQAQPVSLNPVADNTLFQFSGDIADEQLNSNGIGDIVLAGRTLSSSEIRRGLMRFDFAELPAGSQVVPGSLQLELYVLSVPRRDPAPRPFWLVPASQTWGEGDSESLSSAGGAGGGVTAQANDATWFHSIYDPPVHEGQPFVSAGPGYWQQPGALGDSPLDSFTAWGEPDGIVASELGSTLFQSTRLEQQVNAWLRGEANFGWILVGDETVDSALLASLRGFASREFADPLLRPRLSFVLQAAALPGDFDHDGQLTAADIDHLSQQILAGAPPDGFDLDGDQQLSSSDRTYWVGQLAQTFFGDANLDGEFNSGDFVSVFQAGEYEDGLPSNSGWATGDWTGDGEFDTSDFVFAFQSGAYETGPRAIAVPEVFAPAGTLLLWLVSAARGRRRTTLSSPSGPSGRAAVRAGRRCGAALLVASLVGSSGRCDGIVDNDPAQVRPVPPPGVSLTPETRTRLDQRCQQLAADIESLRADRHRAVHSLLPDVVIFHRAVRMALDHNEFFSEQDLTHADLLLDEGQRRATALGQGHAPWTSARGLVVRGFVSKIDHSVQPYGLVVPEPRAAGERAGQRLDVWFHGRGERLGEVAFLADRMTRIGEIAPPGTVVLHPYGRYCNAFKFAGETDVLEAIEAVRQAYPIDGDRISVRGFSMGGAGCWQFAVHYPDRWFAANPGAGFSETPLFLRSFQQETLQPTWFAERLWRWYDCPGYAVNLMHCPTVAYSGELDVQKQAADVMQQALAAEGIELVHLLGPQTKHSIHPETKAEIERRLAALAAIGRQTLPRQLDFQTFTLKYNRLHWLTLDALTEHWEAARVSARLTANDRIELNSRNVTALSLNFSPGAWPGDIRQPVVIGIDGHELTATRPRSDRSWQCQMHRVGEAWQLGPLPATGLRKRHGLQGPIDDAMMESFVFVQPSGPGTDQDATVREWTEHELTRAVQQWRQQFRGDARVKLDTEINDTDLQDAHLVLFGTPSTNQLLARIHDALPIRWHQDELQAGERRYDARTCVPILIYPNPLNPARYVVLNSSFTFREYAYLNNARQVPMLADWAIVDVRTPAGSQFPGQVLEGGFFDETWQWPR